MNLFAPGKVFLAGEYAVLDGHPALVAGVDRGLHGKVEPSARFELSRGGVTVGLDEAPPPELRFAHRAMRMAVERYRPAPYRLTFLDDLAVEGRKLGLGGSAASTVLAMRAAAPQATPEELLPLAVESHWSEQGGAGSGADVAASLFGGVLAARSSGRPPVLEVQRVKVPADLRLLLAFTGSEADTRAFVRDVKLFQGGEPAKWRRLSGEIAESARTLREALSGDRREDALQAVRRGAAAMGALGEAAQVPIVTRELAQICAIASAAGAAGKPSGAGGGDCAVVLCFGDEHLQRVQRALGAFFTLPVRPA